MSTHEASRNRSACWSKPHQKTCKRFAKPNCLWNHSWYVCVAINDWICLTELSSPAWLIPVSYTHSHLTGQCNFTIMTRSYFVCIFWMCLTELFSPLWHITLSYKHSRITGQCNSTSNNYCIYLLPSWQLMGASWHSLILTPVLPF